MKGIVKVEIEIPIEYDEERKEDLIQDLKESFNSRNNKTAHWSSNGKSYSWKFPNKNAKVSFINV